MPHPVFKELLQHPDLPSPKGVALEVLRLAQKEDSSLQEITSVLQADPALCGRLLKVVNSPALGLGRPIASIRQAAALLGLRAVTQLTLGFSLLSENRSGQCAGFDYQAFWAGSLGRAVAMRRMAQCHGEPCPEEAFTCGLLSQVGRLALACVFKARYESVLRLCEQHPENDPLTLERDEFGIDHVVLSATMMADWRIPTAFCEAVRRQPQLRNSKDGGGSTANLLVAQLVLAGDVARILAEKTAPRGFLATVIHQAQGTGIEPLDFIEMFDEISEDWLSAGSVFSVPTSATLSLPEIYAQARALNEGLAQGDKAPSMAGARGPVGAMASSP